jgi:hypothetical protein
MHSLFKTYATKILSILHELLLDINNYTLQKLADFTKVAKQHYKLHIVECTLYKSRKKQAVKQLDKFFLIILDYSKDILLFYLFFYQIKK